MGYALVTGATGVLGRAFCRRLAQTDDLFLTGRSAEKLNELKSELLNLRKDAKILVFPADLTDFLKEKIFLSLPTSKG